MALFSAPPFFLVAMFEIQNYAGFISAIIVFQLIPGPGTLAILNATARNGVAAGLAAVLGTLLGDMAYMLAAIAGLAALIHTYPIMYSTLRWFGIAYLGWMGMQLLRTRFGAVAARQVKQSAWRYFRQASLVSLTNPKVILFFVAFFPLFLRPAASPKTLLIMVLHVSLLSCFYQVGLVLLGNAIARRSRSIPALRKIATWLAGVFLIGFALKLALNG